MKKQNKTKALFPARRFRICGHWYNILKRDRLAMKTWIYGWSDVIAYPVYDEWLYELALANQLEKRE